MKALEAIVDRGGIYGVVLQERAEGVYVFSFATPENLRSVRDDLQADWPMAKNCSARRYGTTEDMWDEIADTSLMAPG
jgi:hypothetical protein